jgi:hypothetical protein
MQDLDYVEKEFSKILEIKSQQKMFEDFKNFYFKYTEQLKILDIINPAYFALPIQVKEHKYYNDRWNATGYYVAVNLSVIRKILKQNMPLIYKPNFDEE